MSEDSYTVQFCCDGCGDTHPPLPRITGYQEIPKRYEELIARRQAVFKGCLVDSNDPGTHECRACGKGTDMPDDYGGRRL